MNFKKANALAIIASALYIGSVGSAVAANSPNLPRAENLLFWSPSEQDVGYPALDRIYPSREVKRGAPTLPLAVAEHKIKVDFDYDHRRYSVDDFMKINRTSAVLVIKDGQIVLERYAQGRSEKERWPMFSVTKSVTSTLIGAALKDGKISSIEDEVTKYIPELVGSPYDGVTIRQVMMMSSGITWSEDYDDPKSDRAVIGFAAGPKLYTELKKKSRAFEPGSKFEYATGNTNVLGGIIEAATGKNLSTYLSEKIWSRYGMEADGSWILSDGHEVAGTCLSMTLRDAGRFGMFILSDGKVGGQSILPDGWIQEATKGYLPTGYPDVSYGYQWWVHSDGTFEGVGIMGQSLLINPASKTVVIIQSAWNNAGTDEQYRLQRAFQDAVLKATN